MTRALALAALAFLLLMAPGPPRPVAAQADPPAAELAPPAAARPAPPRRRPPPRRTVRRVPPAPVAEPPAAFALPMPAPRETAPRPEIAPMPNRSIEGPVVRDPGEGRPSFSPTIIEPRDLPGGGLNRGRNDRLTREDRLFREPAPGATLRLPFSY